jgi:hypothetical protein
MCSGASSGSLRAGSRWRVRFYGGDWWSGGAGCYPMGEEQVVEANRGRKISVSSSNIGRKIFLDSLFSDTLHDSSTYWCKSIHFYASSREYNICEAGVVKRKGSRIDISVNLLNYVDKLSDLTIIVVYVFR